MSKLGVEMELGEESYEESLDAGLKKLEESLQGFIKDKGLSEEKIEKLRQEGIDGLRQELTGFFLRKEFAETIGPIFKKYGVRAYVSGLETEFGILSMASIDKEISENIPEPFCQSILKDLADKIADNINER